MKKDRPYLQQVYLGRKRAIDLQLPSARIRPAALSRLAMPKAIGGKRTLPKYGLTHRKIGFTSGQMARIRSHQEKHDGKSWPNAVRDIFNAGCRALGLDNPPT